jgi:phosphatidylglycerophosphatase C
MPVAAFDLDGTVVRGDSFVGFLGACLVQYPARLLRCVHLPIAVLIHFLGFRDNSWLKTEFLKAIVGGMTRAEVESIASAFVEKLHRTRTKPGALEQIDDFIARGIDVVLVSASPDLYVDEFAARLGFTKVISTVVAWQGNLCLGTLDGGNCYGDAKRARIEERLGPVDYAYSDHDSDLPMLLHATHAVAVDPNRRLARLAADHGIEIVRWGG